MKLLREPLFHFLVAGAALFGAYAWLGRAQESPEPNRARQVRIGAGELQWLRETWTLQWRREPTTEELRGLVAEFLKEELLAREGREMRLDENDTIVRRRLAQKVTFLVEDTLRSAEPIDDELQSFYAKNPERFQGAGEVSFVHVYFNPGLRQDATSDARKLLAELLGTGATAGDLDPGALGDRLLVASAFHDAGEQTVSAAFGGEFAREVFALRHGRWSGPITSGYGLHLVYVSERRRPEMPPLSEVRAKVLREWHRDQEKAASERYLASLYEKYDVAVDKEMKPFLGPLLTRARPPQ